MAATSIARNHTRVSRRLSKRLAVWSGAILIAISLPSLASAIPSPYLWYKGDAIFGATNGNPLSTWQESAAGNNATQVGAARPTYNDGVGDPTYNFLPYVTFAPSGGQFLTSIANTGLSGDLSVTVFTVSTRSPAAGGNYGFGNAFVASAAFGMWTGLTGSRYSIETAGAQGVAFGPTAAGVHVTELRKSPGALNTTTSFWLDGVSQAVFSGAGSSPNVTNSPISIGRWANYAGVEDFRGGSIAELVIYNRVLSQAEAEEVGSYLSDKYNLDTQYPTVPEPSMLCLLGLGICGIAIRSRRRGAASARHG